MGCSPTTSRLDKRRLLDQEILGDFLQGLVGLSSPTTGQFNVCCRIKRPHQ
jgi:hypothetical protein